jgi:hypothetical protein
VRRPLRMPGSAADATWRPMTDALLIRARRLTGFGTLFRRPGAKVVGGRLSSWDGCRKSLSRRAPISRIQRDLAGPWPSTESQHYRRSVIICAGHRYAPPAGFEPAHTAPEAVALSPELWGLALPGQQASQAGPQQEYQS